eukprot:TRINITY_DN419_c0_g1_i4.p1 TRINITY_DN419_c0_g1~~TRINITY_DN419_c0_g1_i4.p1  ORF type:complete len:158 (+),score=39.70 TRINITY_DN419_c0_g1_i4:98-571(+)
MHSFFFFFLMIRRPPRSTLSSSSAASDVYKRQLMLSLLLSIPSRPSESNPPSREVLDTLKESSWHEDCPVKKCSVCLDDFNNSSVLTTMPCGHSFHSQCVKQWLEHHRTCPNCRADVSHEPLSTSFAKRARASCNRAVPAMVETRSMKRRRLEEARS